MNNVRPVVLLLALQALAAGCTSSRTDMGKTYSPPPVWTAPLTPEQVKKWSPQEAKAVLIAWAAIQQATKQPDIMEFRVKPIPTGWEVYVQYVGGHVDGKPITMPGGFAVVNIDSDWKVTRIVGGA